MPTSLISTCVSRRKEPGKIDGLNTLIVQLQSDSKMKPHGCMTIPKGRASGIGTAGRAIDFKGEK